MKAKQKFWHVIIHNFGTLHQMALIFSHLTNSVMLLLANWKAQEWLPSNGNIHTKFHENWSTGSKVERTHTHTHTHTKRQSHYFFL